MGRVRPAVPRSRAAWHHRVRMDPAGLRYWLLVSALAVAVGALVAHAQHRAHAASTAWGTSRTVLVATHPIRAGQPISAAVRAQRWPQALVPSGSVADVRPGDVAAADLTTGSPITEASVRRRGGRGSTDRRTIAVALGAAHLAVDPGDVVDVWATVDPSVAGEVRPVTRRLATGARVVSTSGQTAVLQVRPSEVEQVAAVAASGAAVLVGAG